MIDLEREIRPADQCLDYAFTGLRAERDTRAVLWVGADDALRVLLDGRCVYSHATTQSITVDQWPILLELAAGDHRLLFKVHDETGPRGFVARLCREDGSPAPEVVPILEPREDAAAAALAAAVLSPAALTPAELLKLLPLDRMTKREFKDRSDLEFVAVGPAGLGAPKLAARADDKDLNPRPNAGRGGLLMLAPLSADLPMRAWRRVALSKAPVELSVIASAAAQQPPGAARARVRLGLFYGGELHWLREELIEGTTKSHPDGWKTVTADLSKWAGREALVVVECAESGAPVNVVFLDEIAVR
jgi:hypothetical protein